MSREPTRRQRGGIIPATIRHAGIHTDNLKDCVPDFGREFVEEVAERLGAFGGEVDAEGFAGGSGLEAGVSC